MVRTVLFMVLGASGGFALATLFQGNAIERLELPEGRGAAKTTSISGGLQALEDRVTHARRQATVSGSPAPCRTTRPSSSSFTRWEVTD